MNIRLFKFYLLGSSIALLIISIFYLVNDSNLTYVAIGGSVLLALLYIALSQVFKGK